MWHNSFAEESKKITQKRKKPQNNEVTQDIEEDTQQPKKQQNKDNVDDNGKPSKISPDIPFNKENESSWNDNENTSEEKPRYKYRIIVNVSEQLYLHS